MYMFTYVNLNFIYSVDKQRTYQNSHCKKRRISLISLISSEIKRVTLCMKTFECMHWLRSKQTFVIIITNMLWIAQVIRTDYSTCLLHVQIFWPIMYQCTWNLSSNRLSPYEISEIQFHSNVPNNVMNNSTGRH